MPTAGLADPVTMLNWNLEKGINWREGADWVRGQHPDVVFLQEVQPGQLRRIGRRLGMKGYLASHRPASTNDNAIFIRRGGPFAVVAEYPQEWAPWHAPANIAVRLRLPGGGLSDRQISLVSGHGCYWSPEYRLAEAKWCSTLAKPGWLAVHFWDWNSYRVGEGGPWEGYEDTAFYVNRTSLNDAGVRVTNDRPDREMTDAGYVEMARYAAAELGLPEAMRPSSGYRTHPGRPTDIPPYCIDRGYLTAELAGALTHYEVRDTPELRAMSDHLPLVAAFDHAQLSAILHRPAEVYTPHDNRPRRRSGWLRGRPRRRPARPDATRPTRSASTT